MPTLLNYLKTQIAEQRASEVVWMSFLSETLVARGVGYNVNEIIIIIISEALL